MKIFFELETIETPNNCSKCPIGYYETNYCVLLSYIKNEQVEGDFTKRRKDCPLKFEDEK